MVRSLTVYLGMIALLLFGAVANAQEDYVAPRSSSGALFHIGRLSPEYQAEFEEAVARWHDTPANIAIELSTAPGGASCSNDGLNTVIFSPDGCAGSEFAGVYAVTRWWSREVGEESEIIESDIYFNSAETFAVYDATFRPDEPDFRRVATHELGHAFGLVHSADFKDIMTPGPTDTLSPSVRDLRNMYALYGWGNAHLLSLNVSGNGRIDVSPRVPGALWFDHEAVRFRRASDLSCESNCVQSVQEGMRISVRAVPDAGYSFQGWQGTTCTVAGCNLGALSGNRTLTANFTEVANGGGTSSRVNIAGRVESEFGEGLCALVLASGKYQFSCNPIGQFGLSDLSRDSNGTVKRQIFVDGFLPQVDILSGSVSETVSETVVMRRVGRCPNYNPGYSPVVGVDAAGRRVNIRGSVSLRRTGEPVCAMVLANGKHQFTCDGSGRYDLTIPLDAQGQYKLQVYASGFAPWSARYDEFRLANDVQLARASECGN